MTENAIKIYSAVRMTGRFCDELLRESEMLVRVGNNYGFTILNPVLEESIPDEHKILENVPQETLERFWLRDKEMIRESDVLIDYCTNNKSDGANKELAYNRFCLWKPTIRVWEGPGALISKIEDDIVVSSYIEALQIVRECWGSYEKLKEWRMGMLESSYPRWKEYQQELLNRYNISPAFLTNLDKINLGLVS